MATGLADHLSGQGWDVTVLTGVPKMPDWRIYPEYRGRLIVRERRGRIDLVRTWVYVPQKPKQGVMKAWRRILSDTSMGAVPLPVALTLPRPDVIISITPPLQMAAAAIALKKIWRCPLINWVQDIVPDAALNVGMMKPGLAVSLGRKLEQFVYRHSDRIAVISPGFAANLRAKGVPAAKLCLLTNWTDLSQFDCADSREEVRRSLGVQPDDFVLMHAGSMALKQMLENVVRAMKLLEGQRDIHLFLVGGGSRKEAIERETARLGVPRVTFLPAASGAAYVNILRAADLLILNQSRDLVDSLVPSKLLTYLPAQKPVIAAVNSASEAARFIAASGSGVVVEPENPRSFADAVLDLKHRPADCARMGAEGSRFVRDNFARETVLDRFSEDLRRLAEKTAGALPEPAEATP